jgi:hypothetical protein
MNTHHDTRDAGLDFDRFVRLGRTQRLDLVDQPLRPDRGRDHLGCGVWSIPATRGGRLLVTSRDQSQAGHEAGGDESPDRFHLFF